MNPLLGILLAALLGGAGAASCFGGNALYPWCDDDLCAGSCTLNNGCLCSNSSITCIPNNSTPCVLNSSACCPSWLFWYPAQACCSVEPICSPECLDDEICTDFNGTTKCSCNRTRYQLSNRYDLQPVVQCRGLWMNISISRCLLESFGFDSATISLRNDTSGCTILNQGILDNKSVVTVPVQLQAGWCGNEMSVNASRMRYSNALHVRPASSAIVKVNPLFLSFSCSVTRAVSSQLQLVLSSSSTPGARFARDVSLPSTVILNAPPLYVGLKVTTSDTSSIALRTEECFSNPFGDSSIVNSVQLITAGHAADQGISTRVIENGNSNLVKFELGMFRFVNQSQLFIFCNSRLCNPLTENCNSKYWVYCLTNLPGVEHTEAYFLQV
ncbi:uromodulin-like [Lissotriton helveticus]